MNKIFSETLVFINPMFFYYAIIYAISKVYQVIFNTESIWALIWNKVVDVFGEDPGTHSTWVLNTFAYSVYWIFGLSLILMEVIKKPEKLKDYKIQQDKDEPKNFEKLSKVKIIFLTAYKLF